VRWPGVVARELGRKAWVVEEGLPGRTAAVFDPAWPHYTGLPYLRPALESHAPLDAVVLMLGTNDVQEPYGRSAAGIASDIAGLAEIVVRSACGPDGGAPHLLLVSPPPLGTLRDALSAASYGPGSESSRELATLLSAVAEAAGIGFVDAGAVASFSETDGYHLDASGHEALGRAVAEALRRELPERG
jgi:lysophospholipase L1-like esterase